MRIKLLSLKGGKDSRCLNNIIYDEIIDVFPEDFKTEVYSAIFNGLIVITIE